MMALYGKLKVNNTQMYGKLNQLGNIFELQLFHNICPVGFYRAGADEKDV